MSACPLGQLVGADSTDMLKVSHTYSNESLVTRNLADIDCRSGHRPSLDSMAVSDHRLNQAHGMMNSPAQVSPVMTWLWAPVWFGSHTRYLQRRINALADIQASHRI